MYGKLCLVSKPVLVYGIVLFGFQAYFDVCMVVLFVFQTYFDVW